MEIILALFLFFGFIYFIIKYFRQIVVSGFSLFRLFMFIMLPEFVYEASCYSELYLNIASIIGKPLTTIFLFDICLSIISFINWIPIGKPWITPR